MHQLFTLCKMYRLFQLFIDCTQNKQTTELLDDRSYWTLNPALGCVSHLLP